MLLAIDIGNTNIVIGAYENDKLLGHWRLSSSITRTSDESWIVVKLFFDSVKLDILQINGIIISSVVPNLTEAFMRMAQQYLEITPINVDHTLNLGLKILYDSPETVGADRLCNAFAGFQRFGGPIIVVDFGTATTFDVVTKDKEYLGGIIVPGIEMSANFLHHRTAKLPKVGLIFPKRIIGRTTTESIQSGLMYGSVEMVDGLIRRIKAELGCPLNVIATGGLASVLFKESTEINVIEPFLTLDGLRMIYAHINKS